MNQPVSLTWDRLNEAVREALTDSADAKLVHEVQDIADQLLNGCDDVVRSIADLRTYYTKNAENSFDWAVTYERRHGILASKMHLANAVLRESVARALDSLDRMLCAAKS